MENRILTLLGQEDYTPANVSRLLQRLGLERFKRRELQRALDQLEQRGEIARIKDDRYIRALEADLIPGRIRMNRSGKGFHRPDDPALPEMVVPESATGTAMHEDYVLVRRDVRPQGRRERDDDEVTGKVIRVLRRARMQFVGTLQKSSQFLYVVPDDPRVPHDVYVPAPRDVGRQPNIGDKVVVELREWISRHNNPEGEIVEVLGAADAEGVDMLSILRQYNLALSFPKKVLQEARALDAARKNGEPLREELNGRVDCRAHLVVTIDPDDAKDFDDAFYMERAQDGHWKLWVHIADVSHYVKAGTALDDEGRRRGNSTYLVDRVIPMLPEALSNELCSLKPNVERLTKCVEFLLSDDGRVVKARFYSAVIRSQRRFTYREALACLQRQPGSPIEEMVHHANRLAQKIRRHRFKAGSLNLDFPENKIRLDDTGRVERIERVENDVSHQLIEEFMLLANEAVARRLKQLGRPAIYRIHEQPNEKRLLEYREEVLSHNIPCGNMTNRREVQKLLERLEQSPVGDALKIGFLKSLMRARYSIEPLGHYGLAKQDYAHFTSPIRRYADLVVHRALFEKSSPGAGALKEAADHISTTERNSDDAERDSKDAKLFAFLKAQLDSGNPQSYTALVTDLRNFGFFVDVPDLGMRGLVHLSSVKDDFFQFDSARNQLVGRRTRRIIRIGERIPVQVAVVDRFKKQVDFRLVETAEPRRPRAAAPSRGSRRRGGSPRRRVDAGTRSRGR